LEKNNIYKGFRFRFRFREVKNGKKFSNY